MLRQFFLAVFLFAVGATSSFACTCSNSSLSEHFREVDLVFEGRVISSKIFEEDRIVTTPGTGSYSITAPQSTMITEFELTRPLKGRASSTRTVVHSRPTGGNCGIGFAEGVEYRVFAFRYSDGYTTSMCTYSGPVNPYAEYEDRREEARETVLSEEVTKPQRKRALAYYEYFVYDENREEEADRFFDDYASRVERTTTLDSLDYFFYSADEMEQWRDYENLVDAYLNAIKLAPNAPIYHVGAGKALAQLEQYAESLSHFKKALELDPNNLAAKFGYARGNLIANGIVDNKVADYRGLTADSVDLSRKRASTIDLSGGVFNQLSLEKARISHLRLVRAKIFDGSFKGATLRSARLDASEILGDVDLSSVNFQGASFIKGKFLNVDFSKTNFIGADGQYGLFERADFSDALLDQANFSHASMSGINLTNAVLGSVNFSNAKLGRAVLAGTDLRRINLEGADISGARVDCTTKLPRSLDVRESQLIPIESKCGRKEQNRDFSERPWDRDNFSELDLVGANFSGAHLNGTDFHNSQLQNADFSKADGNASFMGSDLTGASFADAKVRAIFHRAADWRDSSIVIPAAILADVDFTKAQLTTRMFLGNEYYFEPEMDAPGAKFEGAVMECDNRFRLSDIEDYESGEYKELWHDDTDDDFKQQAEDRGKREYDFAKKWIAAEGKFVRKLQTNWPSIKFGEQCQVYFEEG